MKTLIIKWAIKQLLKMYHNKCSYEDLSKVGVVDIMKNDYGELEFIFKQEV